MLGCHYISVLILREFAQLMAAANDPHWDAFFQQGFEPQVHTQFAQLPTTTISVPTTTISVRILREFAPRSGKMQCTFIELLFLFEFVRGRFLDFSFSFSSLL